ncbi:MAG: BMP family ABC transporter substrate-binding protein [Candidatus Limnocylindrales bacterium]
MSATMRTLRSSIAIGTVAVLIAACGSSATTAPTAAPAASVVAPASVAPASVAPASAAAASAAPAAALGAIPSPSLTPAALSKWTTSNPFKAAFIYVGAPSDAGWTHAHDVGRLEVQAAFGGRVQTMYKEDVPEGPQAAQVVTQLINQGANIIFATSFGYQDSLVAAAKAHPNVLFEQATGTEQLPNLAEYYGAGENGDYLSGMAAGAASTTGKIGFVAPYPIPEVIREIDAFTMGAQSMNPNATVRVVWTNTWFAPATERQAAESLVAAGVDVLADGQDSPTTGQVAEAAGLKWTGYDSNQESFAPNAWLTATTYNWGPYYINDVAAAMNGTWKTHFYYGGLDDGFVIMGPFGTSVSAATQAAIIAKENAMKAGTFDPFTGPIVEQNGSIGVPAGVTLPVYTPTGLSKYSISFFVKGVIGNPAG